MPDITLSSRDRFRYWAYYIPFLTWFPQYQLSWFRGDALAAITVASLYIPMCFSFAILGKVEPVNGLYAFIVHPFIYSLLGSSPQMIVGPEATGSLMVGAIIHQVQTTASGDQPGFVGENAHISGVATAIAGAMLLSAGLARIGFVDSVLNRPFMQGFIAGVGFVLVVEQAIPELALSQLVEEAGIAHSSSIVKLWFLLTHLNKAHFLTALISICSLGFILATRFVQKSLRAEYPSVSLFPDRLLVIIVTTTLTAKLALQDRGLDILGSLGSSTSSIPTLRWPLQSMDEIEMVFSTSFLIALLGFFESSVTAKSLRPPKDALQATSLSANRELIALGAANMVGGGFCTLPAFGGFGRSKLNAQTGGTTPMSSMLLSLISLLCVFFVLPYLYYVPRAVLSAMASAVGISMMEECPHEIRFFLKVRGWGELFLMAAVFLATALYSMSLGITVGILITLYNLVKHSTRSRIRVLGRVPGTKHAFEDADLAPDGDRFDHTLIVRIPEPLTFANVGDLRTRLGRFGRYGTHAVHPSLPRIRIEDRCLIFDVQGLTEIDACGIQIMTEIVQEHTANGTQVMFCRLRPGDVMENFRISGIIDICGGPKYFVDSVDDALRIAGMEK
ncbi:sulfate transporter [Neohortaea acidophila]|uniref:Sulfate transporter n=1 Tax=Neohortaea acidophila TaxID=245834 RepID=A0A6A6Q1M8_9PEZI|nr:sulfate transporter [Neohortaea acidophila]KAF2485896.1 sulfate transporter [Neohortaea acidophila]